MTSRSTSLVPPPKRISGDTRYSRSKKLPDAQSVRPEQIDGKVGDPLAQLAGEDLLDADLHGGDATAVEHRRGLVAHQLGDFDVGLGLREAATERRIR